MTAPLGYCDPRFAEVRHRFAESFQPSPHRPRECGAAICVMVDGAAVVDLWGGVARPDGTPWTGDSAPCVFSCTKGVLATLFHIVAAEHGVDYDAPVARWWTEFAAGGKDAITVRELLAHQAGLISLAEPPAGDALDWDAVCTALAVQSSDRTPGSPHGYHSLTFGYLAGELLRRISGRSLDGLLRDYINKPVGAAFAWRGDDVATCRADLMTVEDDKAHWATGGDAIADEIASLNDPRILLPAVANSRRWRAAYSLGASGHASARSLARIYAGLIAADPLLSPDQLAAASAEQGRGPDSRLQVETAYAMGYQLPAAGVPIGHRTSGARPFGHKGAYGSTGLADPELGLAVGYVTNLCAGAGDTTRNAPLVAAIYDAL